ncbi:MAG TPA: NHL repeat-containing protein [Solirubrobacteraceae bacterium]|nr:NHL repeat-containing protein [Solirubrobacteraceae bacterium]
MLPAAASAEPGYTISRFAGNGSICRTAPSCGDGGPARSAQLNEPTAVAVEASGDVYIADPGDNEVRMVSPSGTITRFAGDGTRCRSPAAGCGDGGPATSAELNYPAAVAVDSAGDVYIADTGDEEVRMVSPSGTITTVAGDGVACANPSSTCGDGGPATSAQLDAPGGVAVTGAGDVYIADSGANKVREVSPSGTIATVAGDGVACQSAGGPPNGCGDGGPATSAELDFPSGVAVDSAGNLYIADTYDLEVRVVSPSGTITRFAGDGKPCTYPYGCGDGGPATSAELTRPIGVAVDSGNVYIGDMDDQEVRMVASSGTITTIAGHAKACTSPPDGCGDGGPARSAELAFPGGVAVDAAGHVYVADSNDNEVRLLTPSASPSHLAIGLTPVRISGVTGRPVRQTVAYFATPLPKHGSLRASDFRASVAWGDGQSSAAVVRSSGRVQAGFRGPRRVLEFEVDATHTYTTTSSSSASVAVRSRPGARLGTVKVAVSIAPLDPIAQFYSNPVTATARKITLLIPRQPGPGQRAISSYVWNFGDGTSPVYDVPYMRRPIMSLLRKLQRRPGDQRLWADASRVGIVPPFDLYYSHLSKKLMSRIAKLWLYYFPRHMIPHIYPTSGVFQVSLQIKDVAGVRSIESRNVGVEPHCVSWSGWGPLKFVARGTCDTLTGALALNAPPNRPPDYKAYSISGVDFLGDATATLTVTRDHSVFVSLTGGLGLGAAVADFSVADGYVGPAGLPRGFPRPTNHAVDSFVDGWTIPVGGYAFLGRGAGTTLVYSPSVHNVGEEIVSHFGVGGGGLYLQASCAVDLYHHVPVVGRLAPGNRHPIAHARAVIRRGLANVLAQARKLISDSATCAQGAANPPSILFGG